MRLTKFFPDTKSIDKSINTWVRQSPQQRCILQISPFKGGIIVLYEKVSTQKDDWSLVKKRFMEKPAKDILKRGSRRGK